MAFGTRRVTEIESLSSCLHLIKLSGIFLHSSSAFPSQAFVRAAAYYVEANYFVCGGVRTFYQAI